MKRTPMTLRGAEALRTELRKLKSEDRPNVIKAIAEARGHGVDKPRNGWCAFARHTILRQICGGVGHGLAHGGACDPVGALRSFAAQSENFHAGELGFHLGEVVAFAVGDLGDGAKDDGCREGQLNWKGGQSECAADSAGGARQDFVEEPARRTAL